MKTKTKIGLFLIVALMSLSLFFGQPVSAVTTTQGGAQTGVEVRKVFYLHQDKYPAFADDLHFKLWQKEDNVYVNGWKVTISDFTSSSSQRGDQPEPAHSQVQNLGGKPPTTDPDNGQHAVDVTASGTHIPNCNEVTVDATFWLDQYNTLRIANTLWTKGEDFKEAVPDHGWVVEWPVPDPENPFGVYLHVIKIINDATESITFTGFASKALQARVADLTTITFPTPIPDFTLAGGASKEISVSTDGKFYEGHVYFKYGIEWNATNPGPEFRAIADHPVTPRSPVGGIGVPVDKLGLLAPYIALAVAAVAVTVGAVYARKRWFGKAVLPRP